MGFMSSQTTTNHTLAEAFAARRTLTNLATDVILHDWGQGATISGRTAVQSFLNAFFHTGFPQAEIDVETLVADADGAALSFTLPGQQNGNFLGIPATGRAVRLHAALVCQTVGGQVQRVSLFL